MNLYLLTRPDKADWTEYDGAVVAAKNEDDARLIHPSGDDFYNARPAGALGLGARPVWYERELNYRGRLENWVKPADVVVRLIGTAASDVARGVVLGSNTGA